MRLVARDVDSCLSAFFLREVGMLFFVYQYLQFPICLREKITVQRSKLKNDFFDFFALEHLQRSRLKNDFFDFFALFGTLHFIVSNISITKNYSGTVFSRFDL